MTSTPPNPYGPVPTGSETQPRVDLAKPSLFLAIATIAVSAGYQLFFQIFIRSNGGALAIEDTVAISTIGSWLSFLVALAALIVGFIAITRGGGSKAAPGAAIGVGGMVVLQMLVLLPFSLF